MSGGSNVQSRVGGGSGLQKSSCVRVTTSVQNDASDAGACFALPIFAVRKLRAIREVRSYSDRHVVCGVRDSDLFDRFRDSFS